jgi:hypothetical protein
VRLSTVQPPPHAAIRGRASTTDGAAGLRVGYAVGLPVTLTRPRPWLPPRAMSLPAPAPDVPAAPLEEPGRVAGRR